MIRRQANSMVTLKNIEKNNNLIECDIIPEDSKESGHIAVKVDTNEIESFSLPNGYEWCINHIEHAKTALLEMVKNNNIQKEKLVMWN